LFTNKNKTKFGLQNKYYAKMSHHFHISFSLYSKFHFYDWIVRFRPPFMHHKNLVFFMYDLLQFS